MPDAAADSLASDELPSSSHASSAETASRGRVLFNLGPLAVTPRLFTRALLVVAALGALTFLWGRIDVQDLHARAKALPAIGVIAVISVLPLVGFPVSFLHLVAGVRFDFWLGILVVAVTTLLHHALGLFLVWALPRRWFARIEPWRERLGKGGYLHTTLLCCLLPGVPYTVQLYLKPLIGTPLPLLLGLSPLLHTGRAVVTILLGDMSDDLTPRRVVALVAYYVALFSVSAFSLRRLRRAIAMKNTDTSRPDPAHVAARARHLWQLAGSPAGRDLDFWLQAESELKKESAQVAEQAPEHPAEAAAPAAGQSPASATRKSAGAPKPGSRRAGR